MMWRRAMTVYRHSIEVMFQHCDPAGIVFYPRFFDMANEVTERFFADVVGWPYRDMHGVDRRGIPSASARLDFRAPARLGDRLDWEMHVGRLGRTSATLVYHAGCGTTAVLSGAVVIVHADLDGVRPLPGREDVRAVLAAHQQAPVAS